MLLGLDSNKNIGRRSAWYFRSAMPLAVLLSWIIQHNMLGPHLIWNKVNCCLAYVITATSEDTMLDFPISYVSSVQHSASVIFLLWQAGQEYSITCTVEWSVVRLSRWRMRGSLWTVVLQYHRDCPAVRCPLVQEIRSFPPCVQTDLHKPRTWIPTRH